VRPKPGTVASDAGWNVFLAAFPKAATRD